MKIERINLGYRKTLSNLRLQKLVQFVLLLVCSFAVFFAERAEARRAPVVRIDGSSTVFPITEAMSEEFQTKYRGLYRVTVGISGTGGGFKKFCRGETDIQNASRPISEVEIQACAKNNIEFIELPIAFDATAVVVNKKNEKLTDMTIEELKKIWSPASQSKIMKWSDVNATWPDHKMDLFGAGADSGTFDYFTEAVMGKAKSSRGDYTASEDDNTIVTGVSRNLHALGYMPLAYAKENLDKIKVLRINGVEPSEATVRDGTYTPLSRPVFIYVKKSALTKDEVKKFAYFYIENTYLYVAEVGYVPLPQVAYGTILGHLKKERTGSVFKGHSLIGLSINELLKLEASH